MNIQKQNLKILVRGAYDLQKQRIQTGNRIVGNFKAKLGQSPGESEDTHPEEASQLKKHKDQCLSYHQNVACI